MTLQSRPQAAQAAGVGEAQPPALAIEDLCIGLDSRRAQRPILDHVSLRVHAGETVGLVGESGSGKSVTSRAALGMFPAHATVSGRVLVNDHDVLAARHRDLRRLRQTEAAMIFQDPRAALNPVRSIGAFLTETMAVRGISHGELRTRQCELLDSVGIRDPMQVLGRYPHQLSGGMLQRVMIAAALAPDPALLLADEPTTALDVTIQAEVIAVLQKRRAQAGAAMLFVTHDLELAAATCDRIYVMYAGRIVEEQPAADLFAHPRHPYTQALLAASPQLGLGRGVQMIAGRQPSLSDSINGCPFAARCPMVRAGCESWAPLLLPAGAGVAACVQYRPASAAESA